MRRQIISGHGTDWGLSLCIHKGLATWIDVWVSESEQLCSVQTGNISNSRLPLSGIAQQFAMLITNVLIDTGRVVLS
ncbi:MAG: hypothetical protein JEZ07_17840 [Phycisphaerae bacterium]|nr:hypothetical protein [Phycisphaerae bacterium]